MIFCQVYLTDTGKSLFGKGAEQFPGKVQCLDNRTVLVFSLVTVGTMVVLTLLGVGGMHRLRIAPLERWSHALAGGVIAASGLAILALDL